MSQHDGFHVVFRFDAILQAHCNSGSKLVHFGLRHELAPSWYQDASVESTGLSIQLFLLKDGISFGISNVAPGRSFLVLHSGCSIFVQFARRLSIFSYSREVE